MSNKRPERAYIHMLTAFIWAQRSTCKLPDRRIGCIITTTDMDRVLAIGYNGPPTAMSNDSCRNKRGDCGCLHAEQNAIANVDNTSDKTIFITMEPCERCVNLIAQSSITKAYFCEQYRNHGGLFRLDACCIPYTWLGYNKVIDIATKLLGIPSIVLCNIRSIPK